MGEVSACGVASVEGAVPVFVPDSSPKSPPEGKSVPCHPISPD